jgi:hypothetical protein
MISPRPLARHQPTPNFVIRVVARLRQTLLQRARRRARADLASRSPEEWLRATGLAPGEARALAHELRAFAQSGSHRAHQDYGRAR